MVAPVQTIDKLNTLNEQNMSMVIDFVDYLSRMQSESDPDQENVFRKARKACRDHWMDDEEIDEKVDAIRAERNAARS